MYQNLKKFISIGLIFTLIWVRVLFVLPIVRAVDLTPPTAPSAPSAPVAPSAPPPPNAPPSPPSAPTAPTAPSAPVPPPNDLPTSAIVPTLPTAPTSPPLSTDNASVDSGAGLTPTPLPAEGDVDPVGANSQNFPNGEGNATVSGNTDSGQSNNSGSVNDPANINTGPLSQNSAQEILNQKYEILNKNLAELKNKVDAISSTGFNYANLNTLNGEVVTGDSLSTLNLLNKLNSNMTGLGGFSVFNVYGNYAGDIAFKLADSNVSGSFGSATGTVAKNSVTGPGSSNTADAQNSFKVQEANGNDAKIINDIVLQSSTGNNSSSMNTGSGSIKTGNATALGNIVNLANTNLNVNNWLFGVVNIFGTLTGNILLPKDSSASANTGGNMTNSPAVLSQNSNTGPLSTNNTEYANENLASFDNANTASIISNLDVSSNTGNNTASVNTGGGNIVTGTSEASISNNTIANSNTTKEEGTVWMIIVNEMGKWVGYIVGAPWGSSVASNSLPITTATGSTGSQTYSVDSINNSTGPLTSNNASYNSTADTTVTNNNTAEIVNDVMAGTDSGNNDASFNTGKGAIETGNAKVGVNLVNMVNTNVVAKKFVAVLVNVLGSFLGNIIPPEKQADALVNSTPFSDSSVLPTPTSTVNQLPEEQVKVGGIIATVTPTPTSVNTYVAETYNNYQQYYNYIYYDQTPPYISSYTQAVKKVSYAKQYSRTQRQIVSQGVPSQNAVINQAEKLKRGLFLSPAFAKATESSFPGILLGGASLKVNQSWLSIVPIALVIFVFRRRRRFKVSRYLNYILEVIL